MVTRQVRDLPRISVAEPWLQFERWPDF